jgi:hypothetical protein
MSKMGTMTIPTEPIGSIPRPLKLLDAINRLGGLHPSLGLLYEESVRETIEQFEATGSPVITDGEHKSIKTLRLTASRGYRIRLRMALNCRLPLDTLGGGRG